MIFFTSLILITSSTFLYLFYKIDGYNIVSNVLILKYQKWKSLNNLVSSRYESRFMITYISINMLIKSLYQSLVQYMDNSIVKIDKNKYELTYIINGKLYKMIITPIRGPSPILNIMNGENDVTDIIFPYFGPDNDWHNTKFYPNFFNFKQLTFEMTNGEKKIFNNSETIIL